MIYDYSAEKARLDKLESKRPHDVSKFKKKVGEQEPDRNPPSMELVIAALKFIAENQSLSYRQLLNGLINMGCKFTLEDCKSWYPDAPKTLGEGIKQGHIATGIGIICNFMMSEYGREIATDMVLGVDDGASLYAFVRNATKDPSYTKEYVDNLNGPKRN